ncbi:MAG: GlsB/YeaQ/YmgE family stress response membrane protein, partial [Deltaproteobacteria bacterium]|nr:GlsB/YeaQ/YmgE family stress response membrane protein [Deltaproteobacteria bacterium]
FLFGLVGIAAYGFIGSLIVATLGAVILVYIVGLIKK